MRNDSYSHFIPRCSQVREKQPDLASVWEPVEVGGAGGRQASSQNAGLGTRALIPTPDGQRSPCIPLGSTPASGTGAWARRLLSAHPHLKHFSICLPSSLGEGRLDSGTCLIIAHQDQSLRSAPYCGFPCPTRCLSFAETVPQPQKTCVEWMRRANFVLLSPPITSCYVPTRFN